MIDAKTYKPTSLSYSKYSLNVWYNSIKSLCRYKPLDYGAPITIAKLNTY